MHSANPAGGPGSRSTTSRSGSLAVPRCPSPSGLGRAVHCGTWISSAARFAAQTSVARSSINGYRIVSRSLDDPGTGSLTRRTQAGVPFGRFFSKNGCDATPSGHRLRVAGRWRTWASIASATCV